MGIVVRSFYSGGQVVCCRGCGTHLTQTSCLLSKDFHGQHGRAYLYSAVINVDEGPANARVMTTGQHVVSDLACIMCAARLGWKYIEASEASQRFKVGNYILERSLVQETDTEAEGDIIQVRASMVPAGSRVSDSTTHRV